MQKVYTNFIDQSNNEAGFNVSQYSVSNYPSAFNLQSFEVTGTGNADYDGLYISTGSVFNPINDGGKYGRGFVNANSMVQLAFIQVPPYTNDQFATPSGVWKIDYPNGGTNLTFNYAGLWGNQTIFDVTNIIFDTISIGEARTKQHGENGWVYGNGIEPVGTEPTNVISNTGETHEQISDHLRGQWFMGASAFNPTGQSDISEFQTPVKIYDRSDVILYIGADQVIGTGTQSDLANYTGWTGNGLNEAIAEVLYARISPSTPNSNVFNFNNNYQGSNYFGAEVSFLDYMQARKTRHTTLVKYGIANGTLLNDFDLSNPSSAGNWVMDQLDTMLATLMPNFVQPRVRGLIIHIGENDNLQDIVPNTRAFIEAFRTRYANFDMPVIITRVPDYTLGLEQQFMEDDHAVTIVDTTNLSFDAVTGELTSDGQIQLGYMYARTMKPLLTGELDLYNYDPTFWIDATQYQNFGAISQITDLSINEFNCYQNDATKQPVLASNRINGENAFVFEQKQLLVDSMLGTSGTILGEFFMVCAFKPTLLGRAYFIMQQGSAGGRFVAHLPWTDGRAIFDFGNNSRVAGGDLDVDETYIVTLISSKHHGTQQVRINGSVADSNTTTRFLEVSGQVKIGNHGVDYQTMDLGEMAVWTLPQELDDVQKYEGYMAHKWGVELNYSHPYYNAPPVG